MLLSLYLAAIDNQSSEEQFIDVYNTYKRLVYHTAYKIMGDSYLAEDVLQEVFLYVAKNFSKIHRENCHELAAYETTQKFAGPPETSAYNSREYRVQFYARTCTWTQRQVDIQTGKTVASKTGQADVPSKYLLYSLDHLMG